MTFLVTFIDSRHAQSSWSGTAALSPSWLLHSFLNTLLFDAKFDVWYRSPILLQVQSVSNHSCIRSECCFAEDIQAYIFSPDKFKSFVSHKKGNAVCPKCGRFGTFRKSQCYPKVTELRDPVLFYFILFFLEVCCCGTFH